MSTKKDKTTKEQQNKTISPPAKQKSQTSKQITNIREEIPQAIFPTKFPFWARLKINKNRTTLVIDKTTIEKKNTTEPGFVHREATHSYRKDYEEIKPNPDKEDKEPMYLKRPTKKPQRVFSPHNKKLDMPQFLKDRYEKNNKEK